MNQSANIELLFSFLDELVLRTPALPFISLPAEERVNSLLSDDNFMEAVYLASPILYAECIRLRSGAIRDAGEIKKINTSLIKYHQRMYSRCTPFGLFAGCSLINWTSGPSSIKLLSNSFLRSTRLDMHYLCALSQHLCKVPVIKNRLKFFPNNSCYKMGNELRYIEYRYLKGKRVHQISSVLCTEYLEAVISVAVSGASIETLKKILQQQQDITDEEATEFIEELIASQVLISEMDPAITGDEFIHQLIAALRRINTPVSENITVMVEKLEAIVTDLAKLDLQLHNSPKAYMSLYEKIEELGVSFEENKLFQVDMFSRPAETLLDDKFKPELLQAITVLAKLFSSTVNDNLTSFAERFRKRYEDQPVSLLHVLDAEAGIGYMEQSGNNLSPLLEKLIIPGQRDKDEYEIKWNKTEQWLFDHLISYGSAKEIIIDVKELQEFKEDFSKFPPSLSVMFSVLDNDKIVFRGCSGSSAANLLGRFAHADINIKDYILKITEQEQANNKNVHFAEIIHLPEDRVGNILLHPAFREYEIPFLAQSSLPDQQQVLLQDIMVSVQQDNRIRLFSKKLQQEIIPRLSNAHNYSFGALPVYQFLADLQTQGLVGGLNFNWGKLARHFRYLPRVSCGNVILFEATWQLRKEDFAKLTDLQESMDITDFKNQWQLPDLFVLADGDNELLVDPKNKESVDTFIKSIRGREYVVLKEFLLPGNTLVSDEHKRPYNNQIVAVLMNNQESYSGYNPGLPDAGADKIRRNFLPGSEWLYYKIYCGSKTADEILLNAVLPLTEDLLKSGLIDKWFFIRFNDPEFHLRLRFHIPDKSNISKVMDFFLRQMTDMQENGFAWKIQADTYQRELERYGLETVELTEQLFFIDSRLKLQFLQQTEGDDREKYRWIWGLRGVDEILTAFNYSLKSKYAFMQDLREMFTKEFKADKALFRQLNQQYNDNRKIIEQVMQDKIDEADGIKLLLGLFKSSEGQFTAVAQDILATPRLSDNTPELNQLIGSYIHMSLNRLFLSEPRVHEMIIYDFLCSYYRSCLKRG